MKKLIIIIAIFMYSGFVFSEEIVMNKNGKPVLLKDDGTWELVSTEGMDNKVIFTIVDGVDISKIYEDKDDMGDVEGYRYYIGCKYELSVENNTKHKIKVDMFNLSTTKLKKYRKDLSELVQFNKVLKPGEKHVGKGSFDKVEIRGKQKTSKKKISDNELKELKTKFGCKYLNNSLYISKNTNLKSNLVFFDKKSGISGGAVRGFVVGNENSAFPLKRDIVW